MASDKFTLDRRKLIAGLGAMTLTPALPVLSAAQGRPSLALQAKSDSLVLGPDRAATPVWSLAGPDLRFKRGETLEVTFDNGLPVPAALDWRGIDGAPAAQPLAAQSPLAAGGKAAFQVPLRHAGTFLCFLTGLGDASPRPTRARPLVVGESEPVTVDRDEVLLFEDWRLRADGTGIPPGFDPKDAIPLHTINGLTSLDVLARANERVRVRFINGSQRAVIAIKLEGIEVRVMAIDSQPAEPFQARNGALVIAPGSRVDAFIDVTGTAGATAAILLHDGKEARPIGRLVVANGPPVRPAPLPPAPPLPSNGLPAQLDLKNALRLDVALGGPQTDWVDSRDIHRLSPARLPRQNRPHRGAGTDQSCRACHRLPSAGPSLPAPGPA